MKGFVPFLFCCMKDNCSVYRNFGVITAFLHYVNTSGDSSITNKNDCRNLWLYYSAVFVHDSLILRWFARAALALQVLGQVCVPLWPQGGGAVVAPAARLGVTARAGSRAPQPQREWLKQKAASAEGFSHGSQPSVVTH